jgi:hypothetical protein
MAGLIDTNLIRPELSNAFAAGYRGAEQARQQTQQNQQQFEMNQMKLEQLKQDRAALTDLQSKLRARGQSDDPTFFFRSLIETGNPDYVSKGYEGLQRFAELQRADALLRREAPELFGPAPSATAPVVAAPAAAPTTAPGSMFPAPSATSTEAELQKGRIALTNKMAQAGYPVDQAAPPAAAAVTPNQLAAAMQPAAAQPSATAPAESANAMVQAGTPDARVRELRSKILTLRSVSDPRLKSLADVYEAELKELTKPVTLSPGQQIFSGGRVVYTAPAAPAAQTASIIGVAKGTDNPVYFDARTDQQFTIGTDASGKQVRTPYTGAVNRSTSNVSATANAFGGKLEGAEQKGKGELNVKAYGDIASAARLAAKTLPAIETQARILDQGFTTGFGTEVKKAGASVLAALGVQDAEKFATNAQTFLAATQQAVLQKQLEQKGTQTAADAERITQTGAQFGNTVNGNRFIIDVARAQLRRDMDQREFYDNWWANRKTYEGAENAWYAGEGGKSLFDRPELKKYIVPSAAEADKRTQGLDKIFKQPGR